MKTKNSAQASTKATMMGMSTTHVALPQLKRWTAMIAKTFRTMA
jgi:hypothetical protein